MFARLKMYWSAEHHGYIQIIEHVKLLIDKTDAEIYRLSNRVDCGWCAVYS